VGGGATECRERSGGKGRIVKNQEDVDVNRSRWKVHFFLQWEVRRGS